MMGLIVFWWENWETKSQCHLVEPFWFTMRSQGLELGDWYSNAWTHSQGWEPHLLMPSLSLWTEPSSSAPCLSALGLLCQRSQHGTCLGEDEGGEVWLT